MIINLTKMKMISERTLYALGLWTRARGMIGGSFESFDAMVFPRCGAVHTFFMSMCLDILFVSGENKVLRAERAVKPWRFCVRCAGAVTVVELPAGTLERTGTSVGDVLELNAEPTAEIRAKLKQLISKGPISVPMGDK